MQIDAATTTGAVTLNVADVEGMTAFYREVIGLALLTVSAEIRTLGTPARPLIHLHHLPDGRFDGRTTGLYHLALRVPDRAALGCWLRRYAALDAPGWQGASDHGFSEALYLADPEGNGIEVYADRPRSTWEVAGDGTIAARNRHLELGALVRAAPADCPQPIDPATDMGHIHLRVSDLALARQFYVDLLGFGLKTAWGDSALFVAAGDYHHHLGLNTWESRHAPSKPDGSYGLAAFELLFPDAAARQALVARVESADIPVTRSADTLTIRDPFNHPIHLALAAT
jgi:catechol 2,3-dioxygenase